MADMNAMFASDAELLEVDDNTQVPDQDSQESKLQWIIVKDIFNPSAETLAFYQNQSAHAIVLREFSAYKFVVYRSLIGPPAVETTNPYSSGADSQHVCINLVVKEAPVSMYPFVRVVISTVKRGEIPSPESTRGSKAAQLSKTQLEWLASVLPRVHETVVKTEAAMVEHLYKPYEAVATEALFEARRQANASRKTAAMPQAAAAAFNPWAAKAPVFAKQPAAAQVAHHAHSAAFAPTHAVKRSKINF